MRLDERARVRTGAVWLLAALLCAGGPLGCAARQRPGSPARSKAAPVAAADSQACDEVALGGGLELVVLGSGGPVSAGRAASSYLVAIGGKPRFLIDVGPGMFVRLGETGLPTDQLETVLLTHLHVDHTGDLPGFVKSRSLSSDGANALQIVGPEGAGAYPSTDAFVERLFGSEGAFAYLRDFGSELRLQSSSVPAAVGGAPQLLSERDSTRVSVVAVDHGAAPALAYRIDHGGHSLVVSGDLSSQQGGIVELARGADLLVYDTAVLNPPKSPAKLYELHTAPKRIGEVAEAANVRMLVLGHIPPAVEAHKQEVLASVRSSFSGRVAFAEDCMHVPVTAGRNSQDATVPGESGAKN